MTETLKTLRWRRLERPFYSRDALEVAPELLGAFLVYKARAARIVEVEAYRGSSDLACHARAGLTPRTRTLLGPEAHAYVFCVYGMHLCFNVVCLGESAGHAVLLRAVEPTFGFPEGTRTNGPGLLTRAFDIGREVNGADLLGDTLYLASRTAPVALGQSPRVGVAYAGSYAEAPWRFFDTESRHVSRPPRSAVGLPKPSSSKRS